MKRKPWGGLLLALALAACLSLLPTTAQAAGHTDHPICGTECKGHAYLEEGSGEHLNITWQPISTWDELSAAGTTGGYYYLTTDLEIEYELKYTTDVTLCLNGHSITMNNDSHATIWVYSGSLTLTDCNGDNGSYRFRKDSTTSGKWELVTDGSTAEGDITVTGGVITHAKGRTNCGVLIGGGRTFTMYGGSIVGNQNNAIGGGVNCSGTFNMYGGTITGNTVTGNSDGGGVYQSGGTFTMSGGSITKNSARYGGVCLNNGTFTMGGGSITNNTATNNGGGVYYYIWSSGKSVTIGDGARIAGNTAANGGGVYVNGSQAAVNMTGGTIGGNTAANGGGVFLGTDNGSGAAFTMNDDAAVSGNTATNNGGGVYVSDGTTFNMNGGTVGGNNANSGGKGAGVYVGDAQTSTVTLSGGAAVNGNWTNGTLENGVYGKGDNGTASNIYLPANKEVYVTGALTGTKTIGVTLEAPPAADGGHVTFAQNRDSYTLVDADAAAFFYDAENAGYSVARVGDVLWLVKGQLHKHTVCTSDGCAESGHESGDHAMAVFEALTYDAGSEALVYPGGKIDRLMDNDISWYSYKLTDGTYYLDESITINATIRILGDVTLCLNGKNITSTNSGAVIQIVGDGKLTLCDCKGGNESTDYGKITHSGSCREGGVQLRDNAVFTMYGGSISGNESSGAGAGVNVYKDSTFTMYGGEICNNVATGNGSCGGGIYTAGYTTIGGSARITGNKANFGKGGGVYVGNGTLTLQDRAEITGNSASNNGTSGCGVHVGYSNKLQVSGSVKVTGNENGSLVGNVYLEDSEKVFLPILVVGALDSSARIGVSVSSTVLDDVKAGSARTIARVDDAAPEGTTIPNGRFTVDGGTIFDLRPTEDGKSLELRHDHAWVYTVTTTSNPSIWAKCSMCQLDGGEVWLKDGSYQYKAGTPQGPVPIKENWTAGTLKTVYVADGTESNTRPGAVGDYTIRVTVMNGETPAMDASGQPVQIERTFEIRKGSLTKNDFVVTMPTNAVYNGHTEWTATISVKGGLEGVGAINPRYYENNAYAWETKNAGTYEMRFSVAEGQNYFPTDTLTDADNWTFTVARADYDYRILNQSIVVGSRVGGITVPAGGTGVPLENGSNEIVTGTLTWYSDADHRTPLVDDPALLGTVGGTVTLYWTFQPSAPSLLEPTNSNYNEAPTSGSVELTFTEAPQQDLRFDTSPVSKTYGDDPFTVEAWNASRGGGEVTYTSSNERIAEVDSSGEVTIKKAGTVTITATAAAVEGKYKATSASYTLTVAPKSVLVRSVFAKAKEYDGTKHAEANLTYAAIEDKVDPNDDVYVIHADVEFTDPNVGWEKTVHINPNSIRLGGADADSYTVDLINSPTEVTGIIRERGLTLTHIDHADKDYDGSTDYAPVTGEVFDGLQNGETLTRDVDYTISAVYWPDADAGRKDVNVTVTLLDTAKAQNYETVTYGGRFSFADYARINQLVYGDKTDRLDVRYGRSGTKALGGLLAEARSTARVYAIEGDTSILSAYSLSADTKLYAAVVDDAAKIGASATIRILVTGVNYADYFIDVTVTVSGKENVTISGLTYTNKTYDGQPIAPTGTLTVSGNKVPVDELEVRYTGLGSTAYDSASAPTAAGSYQVTYRVADGNEDYTGSVTYAFTIGRKTATVKPKDVTITEGAAFPAFALEYSGLVSGDTLAPTAAPRFTVYETGSNTEVSAPAAAGSYRIYWIDADTAVFTGAENYALTRNAVGTLTVTSAPAPTPGGSSGGAVTPTYPVSTPEEPENGTVTVEPKNAGKGDTVTVVVKPDEGYEPGTVTVVDKDGNKLPLTDEGGGKYSFVMPEGGATVKADFVKKGFFVDVPEDAFYYEAVKWAVEKGITNGTDATHFSPNEPCTRAQIVTFLWRAAGSPAPKSLSSFVDVPANAYYAKAVAWAAEQGITLGVDATHFDPDATCTRAQGVTFLARAVKAAGDGRTAFTDVPENAYYAPAVKWAADNGVTEGIGGGLFGPNNDCTRAQIVTFLYRLYAKA